MFVHTERHVIRQSKSPIKCGHVLCVWCLRAPSRYEEALSFIFWIMPCELSYFAQETIVEYFSLDMIQKEKYVIPFSLHKLPYIHPFPDNKEPFTVDIS